MKSEKSFEEIIEAIDKMVIDEDKITEYEDRKQAKIDRRLRYANNNLDNCKRLRKESDKLSERFYMGQPILIGHHSEKEARRTQKRMHDKMRNSFKEEDKAKYHMDRAQATANNKSILIDDPAKLKKLVEKYRERVEYHKKIKSLRVASRKLIKEHAPKTLDEYRKLHLEHFGKEHHSAIAGCMFYKSDPNLIEAYELSYASRDVKELKKKIIEEYNKLGDKTKSKTQDDIEVIDNVEDNRLQIFFPDIPGEEVRKSLKANGFRWSRKNGCWQAYRSEGKYDRIFKIIAGE